MQKNWLLAVLCLVCSLLGTAQVMTLPLSQGGGHNTTQQPSPNRVQNTIVITDRTTNPFGFFDDFSGTKARLSERLWQLPTGVRITNTLAKLAPTQGVATFDGVGPNGLPYDTVGVGGGGCDTLTSQPINMAQWLAIIDPNATGVILSFFWQPGGLDQVLEPDRFDSLVLQTRVNNASPWISRWRTLGDTTKNFKYSSYELTGAEVSSAFQFRFINYGRRSGAFDIWHIDYVHLDLKLVGDRFNTRDSIYTDLAAGQAPRSLLREYYGVPYFHLRARGLDAVSDSIEAEAVNRAVGVAPNQPTGLAFDELTGQLLATFPNANFSSDLFLPNQERVKSRVYRRTFESLLIPNPPPLVQQARIKFLVLLGVSTQNLYTNNDTLVGYTDLRTEYALDDGSAELTRFVGGNGSRTAIKFRNYMRDTLRGIKLYIPPSTHYSAQDVQFRMVVYKRLSSNGLPAGDTILFAQIVSIPRNRVRLRAFADPESYWQTIPINRTAPLVIDTGTFYIGWSQFNGVENEVRAGWDVNSPFTGNFYYNTRGRWEQFKGAGTMMIRPMFRGENLPLSTVKNRFEARNSILLFPNPATNQVVVQGLKPASQLQLVNSLGQRVGTWSASTEQAMQLDLGHLPRGLYQLSIAEPNNARSIHKLILE